jgi:hypothetical protein
MEQLCRHRQIEGTGCTKFTLGDYSPNPNNRMLIYMSMDLTSTIVVLAIVLRLLEEKRNMNDKNDVL